ncbi:type I DNA topoisomerase [Candidatus Peregrinibacteria bacterium]|jgi:DNA topoisomerase I|nr:type I DNA topoisomerase [Candidatus Peregrinibacteria bacterium]MBT4631747.1 type I DNA topoisomerase [Candidatus Peregrinibacteria bacterium]MBT5517243.1 type I DNA topoisomerase [Candidatus Peregrinibacteria bacterium]MBT5824528.1 type I DNA topoisomerase [Candidatus Peregrinibacteria bacterium]
MASKNLVIVESPGKIKAVSKYLGAGYKVMASMGHVRDLPKSKMGIEIDNNFKPSYAVSEGKEKVIKGLKKEVGASTVVWIATDGDREGEAIGWHLKEALGLKNGAKLKRIVFTEMTKLGIEEAIKKPGIIDMKRVNAQQARRILDRLVGYELSPLLWKKIKYGLSAGRVQSVAVRLVVVREREIMAFVPEEYWSVTGEFTPEKGKDKFDAKLTKHKGKAIKPTSEKEVDKILKALKGAKYEVTSVEKKEAKRNPAPPFTTSTLQQDAARKFGFSVKKTMVLAQKLYEGIEIDGGHEGLITYMRTDSVTLSPLALKQSQKVIADLYGKEYGISEPRIFKGRKNAQEAHEAIRPTDLSRVPDSIEKYLEKDALKLYGLIWKRTMASQMSHAVMNKVGVNIEAEDYTFRATGQTIKFAGFMKVYLEGRDTKKDEEDDKEKILPELVEGEKPHLKKIEPLQHFTKPPGRYTEATLVKTLEAEGIGRPSTYAPTIHTVQTRGYVEKDGSALKPTDMGFVVTEFLEEHFPKVVDYKFTVRMEEMLDEVEDGKEKWQEEVEEFYTPFHKLVLNKEKNVSREDASQVIELGVDPKTKKPISVRIGRFGTYVQLGTKEDEEKPKFASLPEGMARTDVTLKDALHLFTLPRILGETSDGEEISVNVGRFGPYVKVGKVYYSMKEDDPYTIKLDRAKAVVKAGKTEKTKARIAVFEKEDILILKGPYGPYIKQGKKNYKIPKDLKPEKLKVEDCLKIIAEAPAKKPWRRKKK